MWSIHVLLHLGIMGKRSTTICEQIWDSNIDALPVPPPPNVECLLDYIMFLEDAGWLIIYTCFITYSIAFTPPWLWIFTPAICYHSNLAFLLWRAVSLTNILSSFGRNFLGWRLLIFSVIKAFMQVLNDI